MFYNEDVIICKLQFIISKCLCKLILAKNRVSHYQTVSVDGIAGASVSVTVATSTGAEVGAAGDTLEAGGARLTGQA